jgi:hypothetical protein
MLWDARRDFLVDFRLSPLQLRIMDENVKLLEEVSLLMPNQGISTMSFSQLYPKGESMLLA